MLGTQKTGSTPKREINGSDHLDLLSESGLLTFLFGVLSEQVVWVPSIVLELIKGVGNWDPGPFFFL